MKKLCIAICAITLMLVMTDPTEATFSFPDGTVTANRQDSGTGTGWWWGESVTTLTFDAQSVAAGQYVKVTGKITGISQLSNTNNWVEIGLIRKDAWDYWQNAYGGAYKSAVFDKGIYVVQWTEAAGTGLQLQEGWWSGGSTVTLKGGYVWGLSAPSAGSPWDFTISMYPTTSGNAYLSMPGETIYGTEPLSYSGSHGYGDFSECYLIAQIWTDTQNATFSFTDVQATVIPEPATLLLFGLGGLALLRKRTA